MWACSRVSVVVWVCSCLYMQDSKSADCFGEEDGQPSSTPSEHLGASNKLVNMLLRTIVTMFYVHQMFV